jgi:diguanylate cyclase
MTNGARTAPERAPAPEFGQAPAPEPKRALGRSVRAPRRRFGRTPPARDANVARVAPGARVSDWQWKAFLAIGVAMAIGYFLLPGQAAQNIAYQIPESLAAVAVLAGIVIHKPADRRPWFLLAGGLILTTTGDWTWVVLDLYGQTLFPSIADIFYLAGMGLIVASMLLLVRGRVPGGDRAGVLDALIVAVGIGMLSWVFLMEPIVQDTTQSLGEIAVALAYPAVDILLIGVLARLFLSPGRRVPALYLLLGALVSLLLSDYIYAFLAISDGCWAQPSGARPLSIRRCARLPSR